MLFHTPEFILFLLCTLGLYYCLPKYRIYIIALADILFYMVGGAGLLFLFIIITTATYLLSRGLHGSGKKLYLIIGIVINVANLVFFKYSIFLLSNLEKLISAQIISHTPYITNLVMPIGISFYTFQFIAYLVDIYKGKTEPAPNLLSFWVFMSFFPHRVAGPIMRGKDLIPQIERIAKITFNSSQFKLGLAFLAMGLIKKIFLADYIAIYANRFFDQGTALTGSQAWIGALLFTFQIYYDFSAYSEMAVGIAYLFGIKLDLNFKTPYLSGNPSEFWRRWHITLSTWIRDYIYIPLGGSRRGEYRKYLHLFIAMAISGLWHGAAWTFVVWGIYHGLLLILHNLYTKFLNHYNWEKITSYWFYKVLTVLVMFNLANIGWVFFRADNLGLAYHMVASMLTTNPLFFDVSLYQYVLVILALYSLHVVEYWLRKNYTPIYTMWERRVPAPLRALVYTALIAALVIFAPTQQNSFIYFRF